MLTDLIHRLRSLIRRDAVEQELDDELRYHRDQLVDRYVAEGLPHDEAMRRARLDMGGFDQIKEEHRDARGTRLLEDLGSDLKYAVRQVRRSPGFAVLAILCLGLGIGANTSIFSALNACCFVPLPVVDPARLLMLSRGGISDFSYPDFQDLQARAPASPWPRGIFSDGIGSGSRRRQRVRGRRGRFCELRRSAWRDPALGRWFTSETEPVAVISHAVWQNRFGGNADVLGRSIGSEAQSYTIVGVAPRAFTGHLRAVPHRHLGANADTPHAGGDARRSVAPARHGLRAPRSGRDAGFRRPRS